jgi:4-amino-4-deoxy-L-arabinose transferase-like glycosyltransferase
VHPPLGKETIAVGEWLFGLTPFGWRLMVAILGSLAILMTARIARRMTRSNLLGCVAGLLLALDGLEFVMSRTALLDISVMFWVLAAFGCLLIVRDRSRLAGRAPCCGRGKSRRSRRGWMRPLPPGPGHGSARLAAGGRRAVPGPGYRVSGTASFSPVSRR